MMKNQSLEVKGNLAERPFAEVLAEAAGLKLDGSFRLNHEDHKAVVYLRNGDVVFAVSNAREHRLFQMVLQQGKLKKEQLVGLPLANDFEFAQSLTTKGLISEAEIREIFTKQVEKIVKDLLYWQEGDWIFSILARARDFIDYKINLRSLLFEYARNASIETIKRSFANHEENLSPQNHQNEDLHLSSLEAFVFYRFESHPLKLNEILFGFGLPENTTLKAIYALWLGGLLTRENQIFSDEQVAILGSIKLQPKREEVKKEEVATAISATSTKHHQHVDLTKAQKQMEQEAEAKEKQELEAYLSRVENASNYYQVLGVSPTSSTEEIKTAYFRLAKRFHPDKYHKEAGTELHRRIQSAFGEIAKAYETLKDEKSRKSYDLKNKDKIKSEKPEKSEEPTKAEDPITTAKKSFEKGYELLMRKEYETAYPLLARAVFLDPNNAQYHAYFGKLLSADERMRFRAEEEIKRAINIEPQNPLYRIMLAELYMDYGFYRRAEGELKRLLEIDPKNKQALEMLRKIPEK